MTPIEIKHAAKHICEGKRYTYYNTGDRLNLNILMLTDDPDFISWIAEKNPKNESDVAQALYDWQTEYYAALELSRTRNAYMPHVKVLK